MSESTAGWSTRRKRVVGGTLLGLLGLAAVGMILASVLVPDDGRAREPRTAFVDSGPTEDILQIREVLPRLVEVSTSAGGLPSGTIAFVTDEERLRELVDDPELRAERVSALTDTLTAERAAQHLVEINRGFEEAIPAHNPDWWFVDNNYAAQKWQGISVEADTATVLVTGGQSFTHLQGGFAPSPTYQTLFTLQRATDKPFGWVIADQDSIEVDPPVGLDWTSVWSRWWAPNNPRPLSP
ncbi:hypothetical protein D9V32_11055 [Mycetocola tolaasinivorans]|uniref:Uncharacterized protein n=1 Tax=Mycetocola tolaasinivorans TaxID=76635 RepID=A0A3L7A3P8_9MICO|nr:hypothetical protein [Mycetocola tolaasinivorans]RLP74963.1 hypothetical protein D9V32_11055 [Mycetocola tolaasinivorans]